MALLTLAALGCRGGAPGSAPAPSAARAAPATVREALECARGALTSRGFSDIEWSAGANRLVAQIPFVGTEPTVRGRVVRQGRIVVSVLSFDAAGYPLISASGTGRTKEFTRLAVSAADVRSSCSVRLGEKADPPPAV